MLMRESLLIILIEALAGALDTQKKYTTVWYSVISRKAVWTGLKWIIFSHITCTLLTYLLWISLKRMPRLIKFYYREIDIPMKGSICQRGTKSPTTFLDLWSMVGQYDVFSALLFDKWSSHCGIRRLVIYITTIVSIETMLVADCIQLNFMPPHHSFYYGLCPCPHSRWL